MSDNVYDQDAISAIPLPGMKAIPSSAYPPPSNPGDAPVEKLAFIVGFEKAASLTPMHFAAGGAGLGALLGYAGSNSYESAPKKILNAAGGALTGGVLGYNAKIVYDHLNPPKVKWWSDRR